MSKIELGAAILLSVLGTTVAQAEPTIDAPEIIASQNVDNSSALASQYPEAFKEQVWPASPEAILAAEVAASETRNGNVGAKTPEATIPNLVFPPPIFTQRLYPINSPDICPAAKVDIWIYSGILKVATFFGSRSKANVMAGGQQTNGYSMTVGPDGCKYKITIERE